MKRTEQSRSSARDRVGTYDPNIQVLFDAMARGLVAGDGGAVAGMWRAPALVLGEGDERLVGSDAEIRSFFGSAREQYNQRGIGDTRADVQRLEWLNPSIALVEVRWPYLDGKGNELGGETSTYLLKRDDSGNFKLRVAVMHGSAEGSPL